MNDLKIVNCPVCNANQSRKFMTTKALMHTHNHERYIFNLCDSCESVFLTNPVKETDLTNYYTDDYLPYKGAEAWGKYQLFVAKSQMILDEKKIKTVKSVTKNKSNFSILDVGCGNPSFLVAIQKKMKADCTGIDFSDNGWKDKNLENIQLLKTTIANFIPDKKFDVVTLWHYLEHDYNLQETVIKLYNCIKPGGKLIIEVPDYKSITARHQQEFWEGWHSPRHLTFFSKKGFQKLFTTDKWTIIKHQRFGTLDAFTLWWMGNMEKKNSNWNTTMEGEFWKLVFLKMMSFPFFIFEKFLPMGIQLIILEKK